MYKFSEKSKSKLQYIHPELALVCKKAINVVDFTIIEGIRSLEQQKALVRKGKSKTINSKHIKQEDGFSHAVDIAPYPIDWEDYNRFFFLAGVILGIADTYKIKVRWGGDWDSDRDFKDQTFNDYVHFELIEVSHVK